MPFGRYHDIPRTNPGGRVNPRFRPKGPPSSLAQLRAVVWTNCTRDTRPEGEVHSINIAPLKRTHKPDPRLSQLPAEKLSHDAQIAGRGSPTRGARGNLHLEGRTLAQRRLDPNATAVHLHNLLGNGKTKTGAALGPRVGVVDLLELLEDPRLMFRGDTWAGVRHADVELAVDRFGRDAHLARVGELDGVAY